MRPTYLTQTELTAVDLLTTRIEADLKIERTQGNRRWFTGAEIATKLAVSEKHGMIFNYAFCQLRFDRFEIDGDTIRHRR